MTQTINIPDHHGCNLTREQTNWPVFDDHQEYRGHITFIQSTAIPKKVYEQLKLGDRTDIGLFLTPAGQWATTLEYAEHLLVNTEPPIEFLSKGATLGFFLPPQWSEENGTPNKYADYRVYQRSPGHWDAEEIEPPVLATEGYEPF
jgi:hypothetical protein